MASQPCAAWTYGTKSGQKWRHMASQPYAAWTYVTARLAIPPRGLLPVSASRHNGAVTLSLACLRSIRIPQKAGRSLQCRCRKPDLTAGGWVPSTDGPVRAFARLHPPTGTGLRPVPNRLSTSIRDARDRRCQAGPDQLLQLLERPPKLCHPASWPCTAWNYGTESRVPGRRVEEDTRIDPEVAGQDANVPGIEPASA